MMDGANPTKLQIRDARIDLGSGDVVRNGSAVRLEPKAAMVLARLAREPGAIVSKKTLLAEVWNKAYLSDDVLWRSISQIRQALGDSTSSPTIIETLPRRGYRLIAGVGSATDPESGSATLRRRPAAIRGRRTLAVAAAAAAPAAVAGVLFVLSLAPSSVVDQSMVVTSGAPATSSTSPGTPARAAPPSAQMREIEAIQHAVDRGPPSATRYARLATAYSHWGARRSADSRWTEGALDMARNAVALDAALPEAQLALATALRVNGRWRDATAAYRRVLAIDPERRDARLGLAALERQQGRLAASWQRTSTLSGDEPTLDELLHLGQLQRATGLRAAARQSFDRYLRSVGPDEDATAALARLDLLDGRRSAAREALRRCLEGMPGSMRCAAALADLEILDGRLLRAKLTLARALNAGFQRPTARVVVADLFVRQQLGESVDDRLHAVLAWTHDDRRSAREDLELPETQAAVLLMLGDQDAALERLGVAFERGYRLAGWLAIDPLFAALRTHPGFGRLLAKMEARRAEVRSALAETESSPSGPPPPDAEAAPPGEPEAIAALPG